MKTPTRIISRNGFTLVELLVVIAIIAVLAAAGFAGGNAAMQRAKKVTAQAAATSVATAVEQFYTEYSALPNVDSQTTTDDPELLNILAGLETGDNIQNDRKIRFLTLKEAKKGNRDGVVFSSDGNRIQGLYDPWGEPYHVVLDQDYDERITVSPQGSPETTLNGRKVAVYSLGTDTPADAGPNSLVKTW